MNKNEWQEIIEQGIVFYRYEFENGDIIIYSMNKDIGLLDCFAIHSNDKKFTHYYNSDELSSLNMLYIASREDTEMLRAIMKLTYREMVDENYSFLKRLD